MALSSRRAERWDLVVVGGGSAGCVVAARVSADEGARVLLLEAGPDPQPLPDMIAAARRDAEALLQSPYIALYPTIRPLDGSSFPLLAGRIMGGGSSVNFMSFMRPTAADCGRWAAYGGEAWSFDELLPVMRRIERDEDYPDDALHGHGGPINVKRTFDPEAPMADAARAFFERALELGLPYCRDLNVPSPFGIGPTPGSVLDGRRQSTRVAYLDPARARPNLRIEPDSLVTRLVVRDGRVVGVRYVCDGSPSEALADRVVLCAGVFHSPQVLMLSGIGPPDELRRLGIDAQHRLDGVGANFQDHATVYLTFEGRQGVASDAVLPKFRILGKSHPALAEADLNVFMRPPTELPGLGRLLPVSVHLLQHRSRGRLCLDGTDPTAQPIVETGLLTDADDVAAIVRGMEFVAELCGGAGLAAWYGPLLQPEARADFATFAQSTFSSYDHGVGTCRIGPAGDAEAVVDASLRVHGLENLWIADASVLPVIPHVNTNLSAVLVGEVAARSIAADVAGAAALSLNAL